MDKQKATLDSPPAFYESVRQMVTYISEGNFRINMDRPIFSFEKNMAGLRYENAYLAYQHDDGLATLNELLKRVIALSRPSFTIRVENIPNFSSTDVRGLFNKTGMLFSTQRLESDIQFHYDDWTELALLKLSYAIEEYSQRVYPELFETRQTDQDTSSILMSKQEILRQYGQLLTPEEAEQLTNSTYYDRDYNLNLTREQLRAKLYAHFRPGYRSGFSGPAGGA